MESVNIEKAIELAKFYHGIQKYADEPYFNHLERVWKAVKNAGYGEDYQIVALLHDAVEDTHMSYLTIEKNFGVMIASAVASITHPLDWEYFDYIRENVMSNPIAKVVKFFDILDNFEHSISNIKYSKLKSKYIKALMIISGMEKND